MGMFDSFFSDDADDEIPTITMDEANDINRRSGEILQADRANATNADDTASTFKNQLQNDRRVRLRPKTENQDYFYGDSGLKEQDETEFNLASNRTVLEQGSIEIPSGTYVRENNTEIPTDIKPDKEEDNYNSILTLLRKTNGMVWNVTPTINESRQVNYSKVQPIHTNAGFNAYKNTSNTLIYVLGDFYANSPIEAMYLLGCIHFLRTSTQMDFGRKAKDLYKDTPAKAVVGAPPPVLLFSAYGDYMYGDVPVIVKSYTYNYNKDVDYVQVPFDVTSNYLPLDFIKADMFFDDIKMTGVYRSMNYIYVPQKMTINLQLEVQPSPFYMSETYNLNEFKTGQLYKNTIRGIGGII